MLLEHGDADGRKGFAATNMPWAALSLPLCRDTTSGWEGTACYLSTGISGQPLKKASNAMGWRSWVGKQRVFAVPALVVVAQCKRTWYKCNPVINWKKLI